MTTATRKASGKPVINQSAPSRHGGARPGAGRPKGSKNRKPQGFVSALKGWRIPPGTPPEAVEVADYALSRVIDVAAERVPSHAAPSVLKACITVRDEICGPVATRMHIDGNMSLVAAVAAANAQIATREKTQAAPEDSITIDGPSQRPPPSAETVTAAKQVLALEAARVPPTLPVAAPVPAAQVAASLLWRPTPASKDSPATLSERERWGR